MVTRESSASCFTRRRFVIAAIFALAVVCLSTWLVWSQARAESGKKLDAQLAAIGAEVKKQLSTKENGEQIADWAAQRFVAGLRAMRDRPFTDEQHTDIKASLASRGFLLTHGIYPDPTELEIEYCRLMWTDMIEKYTERAPLSQSDKDSINAQIDELLLTAETIAKESAPSETERDRVSNAIE